MADTPAPNAPTAPDVTGGGTAAKLRETGRKATDTVRSEAGSLAAQASEKARAFADDGKAKASDKLGDVARLIGEAADTVDQKVGEQYGAYARQAADLVDSFAEQLRNKDVDDLVAEARAFVQKSPAVAIGVAAAVGFVLARLARAGFETADQAGDGTPSRAPRRRAD